MLDRESTFAQPEIVELLKNQLVPVAIDQAYQRRQKDAEGDFYRLIAKQGPRDIDGTTQGFYIATASGKLLLYNNNRNPERVLRLTKEAIEQFASLPVEERSADAIELNKPDERYNPVAPSGGLTVRVRARVLGGYEPTDDPWRQIFQSSTSRDNLWITSSEHKQLVSGIVPQTLATRIARFHLVDNTRGEPPMWKTDDIREITIKIEKQTITGSVHLQNASGSRGFTAELLGDLACEAGKVMKLSLVAKGLFWGDGPYTRGAPEGKFPLAVTFSLADGSDTADAIPPQGSRGWVRGYLEP